MKEKRKPVIQRLVAERRVAMAMWHSPLFQSQIPAAGVCEEDQTVVTVGDNDATSSITLITAMEQMLASSNALSAETCAALCDLIRDICAFPHSAVLKHCLARTSDGSMLKRLEVATANAHELVDGDERLVEAVVAARSETNIESYVAFNLIHTS